MTNNPPLDQWNSLLLVLTDTYVFKIIKKKALKHTTSGGDTFSVRVPLVIFLLRAQRNIDPSLSWKIGFEVGNKQVCGIWNFSATAELFIFRCCGSLLRFLVV
jgi:hypothetical protein